MVEISLFRSRKFWLAVSDVVVSLVTYFVGKYLDPKASADILFLIGSLQPVWLLVIGSIVVQNVAGIKAQSAIDEAIVYNEKLLEPPNLDA
jgi:hypothetical protein